MKATLEFDRPEDDEAIRHALAGAKYHEALCELHVYLDVANTRSGGQDEAFLAALTVCNEIMERLKI